MTKRELIQFMNELVELASEENKSRAILVKEKFINDFERSYEYEKEVQTEVSYLPPYYIAAMPFCKKFLSFRTRISEYLCISTVQPLWVF